MSSKKETDIVGDVERRGAGVVPLVGHPALRDEELLPVPAHVVAPQGLVDQHTRFHECQARGRAARLVMGEKKYANILYSSS